MLELLARADDRALADLAITAPGGVARLAGRLWDPDPRRRDVAARALGRAAAARPDQGLEAVRRLMWTLNDESGTHGLHALRGLGEIGAAAPRVIAPFVAALAGMAGDAGLRRELLAALIRIAESDPALLAPHWLEISAAIDAADPATAEELGRLRQLVEEHPG
jgi:hypothetical protein